MKKLFLIATIAMVCGMAACTSKVNNESAEAATDSIEAQVDSVDIQPTDSLALECED